MRFVVKFSCVVLFRNVSTAPASETNKLPNAVSLITTHSCTHSVQFPFLNFPAVSRQRHAPPHHGAPVKTFHSAVLRVKCVRFPFFRLILVVILFRRKPRHNKESNCARQSEIKVARYRIGRLSVGLKSNWLSLILSEPFRFPKGTKRRPF